jgi:hypothetical protein
MGTFLLLIPAKEQTVPLLQNLRHKKHTYTLSVRIYIAFRSNVILNIQTNKDTKPAPSISTNYSIPTLHIKRHF